MSTEKENVKLPDFMEELAKEKKLAMAKAELYPHLVKIVDAMIEVKGVTYTTADVHSSSRKELWAWVLKQVE